MKTESSSGGAVETFRFDSDGEVPNNPDLPLVVHRGAVPEARRGEAATWLEQTFAANGWVDGWRNGIYPFRHFHTGTHEVLGIAQGRATVEFGGAGGRALTVERGDVVILPAGTCHKRLEASADLLVVGAYPHDSRIDQDRPGEIDIEAARRAVAAVPLPARDPVMGQTGAVAKLWRKR